MEDAALLLEKSYQIPFQLFKTSFTAFQKKFVYPRTYLTMGLLAGIIGIYAYFIANGNDSQKPLYCMIIIVCAALIGFQWYNPRKIRLAGMLINSPLWIVYSLAVGSWAGVLDEVVTEASMIISILRYGWKNLDRVEE